MRMPFSVEQFLDVFRRYNEAVWPAQWVLVALALLAVVTAAAPRGSFIGTMAAVEMGMLEDFALLPAALVATGVTFSGKRRIGTLHPA